MHGVGFLIKKYLAKHIIEFKGISERIALLRIILPMKTKEETWNIIQVYASTETNKQDEIEEFYLQLQNIASSRKKNLVVIGDFNGKIGKRLQGEENIMGHYAYGARSKNGSRLINFALENNLAILNSFSNKKPAKKWTWVSPNGKHTNEIDYILTNKRKLLKTFQTINNFNFNTDHRMLRTSIETNNKGRPRKYNVKTLQQNTIKNKEILTKNLKGKLHETFPCNLSVTQKYDHFIKTINNEITKSNSSIKKEITPETLKLINRRKEMLHNRTKNHKEIIKISKEINVKIRKDRKLKRKETIKTHIEKTGGIKKALKELTNKKDWMTSLKDKTGKITRKRMEILQIATDYYKNLYSSCRKHQKSQFTEETWSESLGEEDEEVPIILLEETIRAIKSQKHGKAPGTDLITNELSKALMNEISSRLNQIFNEILKSEEIPKDWTKSTTVLIHKKGDYRDIGNYRPISIMSNIYKVFSKILLLRMTKDLEEQQPLEQAGFRRNFSTLDHIHVLKHILQKYREYNKQYIYHSLITTKPSTLWNTILSGKH
ncbi:hypothetical protein K1T71_003987 [Dendrolimus kikuchii]|uniref:Uncharacterized protein n=1 Tax=Dendrolimus kikuchii TaxID=765133 RepID=A0ACC1DAG4_9NEOP|nr:hypothetical protein K1T71_003987 [Dendrolimus kikuchii]